MSRISRASFTAWLGRRNRRSCSRHAASAASPILSSASVADRHAQTSDKASTHKRAKKRKVQEKIAELESANGHCNLEKSHATVQS